MKLNRQAQDLHAPHPSADWVLKQQVERDICLLYHQLTEAGFIMGDLYYGQVYTLPYWDFLDFPGIEPEDRDFLRDGCLVMMLAMAWDVIDCSGTYLLPHIPACRRAVAALSSSVDDTHRLADTVVQALDAAERAGTEEVDPQALWDSSTWVYQRYVLGYFSRMVQ